VFSTEQIRAAGNNAYQTLNNQVTVTDNTTLDQIATQNNTTVPDILAANPDMNSPQTGMVLNVPRPPNTPGSPGWQGSATIGGLPSNGPLGGTTNNPNGYNPYAGVNPNVNLDQRGRGYTPAGVGTNTFASTTPNPLTSYHQATSGPATQNPFSQLNNQSTSLTQYHNAQRGIPNAVTPQTPSTLNAQGNGSTFQPVRPIQQPRVYNQQSLAGLQAHRITELYDAVNAGGTPTENQLQYLIERGLIAKPTATGYSGYGGGGYRRFGGGGRGGGGGRAPSPVRGTSPERLPAFSSGQGGFGLINWRI
jgi:hypothetical protein